MEKCEFDSRESGLEELFRMIRKMKEDQENFDKRMRKSAENNKILEEKVEQSLEESRQVIKSIEEIDVDIQSLLEKQNSVSQDLVGEKQSLNEITHEVNQVFEDEIILKVEVTKPGIEVVNVELRESKVSGKLGVKDLEIFDENSEKSKQPVDVTGYNSNKTLKNTYNQFERNSVEVKNVNKELYDKSFKELKELCGVISSNKEVGNVNIIDLLCEGTNQIKNSGKAKVKLKLGEEMMFNLGLFEESFDKARNKGRAKVKLKTGEEIIAKELPRKRVDRERDIGKPKVRFKSLGQQEIEINSLDEYISKENKTGKAKVKLKVEK